jgi:hypothetical protein
MCREPRFPYDPSFLVKLVFIKGKRLNLGSLLKRRGVGEPRFSAKKEGGRGTQVSL